jgi:hypothetical protein
MFRLRPAPTLAADGLYGDGILHESHRPSGILHASAESLSRRRIGEDKAAIGFTLGPEREDARC